MAFTGHSSTRTSPWTICSLVDARTRRKRRCSAGSSRAALLSKKRMEPSGATVLKEALRLYASGQLFTFNCRARSAWVARDSCAFR